MYFKERQNSPLYQHYQKQEHQRLARRIQQIRTQRIKPTKSTENLLPPIQNRGPHPSDQRLYQKRLQLAETDRLYKRLDELKHKKSDYFSKVIGLNLSIDLGRVKKTARTELDKANQSGVEEGLTKTEEGFIKTESN